MRSAAQSPRLALLAGAAVLAALAVEATAPPIAIYDEGVVLASAYRVALGELPWRDYDPVYGPLEPLLLGGLGAALPALGVELLAMRLERALLAAGMVALLAASALRLGGGSAAALVAAAAIARRATVLVHPALPLLVATAWLVGRALRTEGAPQPRGRAAIAPAARARAAWLVLAGLAAGGAGLARVEFGALAALVGAGTLVLVGWARRRPARALARELGAFAAGGAPALLALGALVALAGPASVAAHAVATGALVEHRAQPFPLPPPEGTPLPAALDMLLVFGLPLVALPAAAVAAALRLARARRAADGAGEPAGLALHVALALAGAGLLPYALSRPDLLHFVPVYAVACALAAAALGPLEQRLGTRARTVAAVGALALLLVPLFLRARAALALRGRADHVVSELAGARGLVLPRPVEETWRRTVDAVRARVPEGEPVFVGCARHDRVHVNDGLLYVLLRRPPATRHHCFNPGVTTSADKQAAMVRELETARPGAVVLVAGLTGPAADDPPGAQLLDRWLASRYARAETFGGYRVLARR